MIPDQLKKNIIDIYAEQGLKWLDGLPDLLNTYETKLQLKLDGCYVDANFNYVAPAYLTDGSYAVLKCSPPDQSQKQEALALRHYNGQGCVQLLFFDENAGVMLLEKAEPGHLLENYSNDAQACEFAIEIMRRLHKSVENIDRFPSLNDWFDGFNKLRQRFDGKTGPFPETLIDKAEKISSDLLASMSKNVLLHGDLHYANILSSDKHGWIAIDPKGVVGEPEFEIPLPRLGHSPDKKTIQQNIDRFVAISGFDRERVVSWIFVKATLAAWWSFEDSGEIAKSFLQCAECVGKI
ncbi:MAG: Streptomycin 6-kinase [uncultured bacterium]|nr:MAG: Streptomycin 6-kinase [uncultured bacterium]